MIDILATMDAMLAKLYAARAALLAPASVAAQRKDPRGGARHGRPWTAAEIALMRERYATTPGHEMCRLLGRTKSSIQPTARKLGLKHTRYWLPEEIAIVRELYPHTDTKEIARRLGRRNTAVLALANSLRIRKSKEFLAGLAAKSRLAEFGAAHRYRKGNVPANKGVKSPGYAPGRMRETWFRSDKSSWRTMPVGHLRTRDGYVYRKVADTMHVPWTRNWKLESHLVWEAANGPLPAGHIIVFRDRNPLNTALANLECITLKENALRNSIHNLPAPLKEVIMLNGRLKRKIRRIDEKQTVRPAEPSVRDARSA